MFEKCLCDMFGFQLGSLHISKDVAFDANNNVSNSVYWMLGATIQGQEWVVSFGCYKVVGDNVFAHSKETILMPWKTTSMVKTIISRCNKMEDIFYLNAKHHTFNIVPLYVFIDLFGAKRTCHPWCKVMEHDLAILCLLLSKLCSFSQH